MSGSPSHRGQSWSAPQPMKTKNQLKLWNSFTRQKEIFIPLAGNRVTWYNCGPTVYDHSHMGHARSYITFDIIRRVLEKYFNYDVFFVQNITDIDDKIIRRARQQHLYNRYINDVENSKISAEQVLKDVQAGVDSLKTKLTKETDPDKKALITITVQTVELALTNSSRNTVEFVTVAKDVLSEWLDKMKGHEVTENSIFSDLPREFELLFYEDMAALNVLPPHSVTRVSEYVPDITEFIEKIIQNKYGYESNGSVYFDVKQFDSQQQHSYAKLVPEAVGDLTALAEGEGDLHKQESEKKNVCDFVLWKKSKPGEPSWKSPWGDGRPGWHIECSVMASQLLGNQIDIHSGGIDLKFPHHDNEIAQSEAYFNTGKNWINYFIHSGHLTISGCKMSKSLKNFITIKEALKRNSSRQLRLAFLLHPWKDTLDYSDNTMSDALAFEKSFFEFFLNVKDIIRSVSFSVTESKSFEKWSQNEQALNTKLLKAQELVDHALCDNIDTRASLDILRDLVGHVNVYLKGTKTPNALLIRSIANYVAKILVVFGVVDEKSSEIKFESSTTVTNGELSNLNKEELLMPYLEQLASFREKMRAIGMNVQEKAIKLEILGICDDLRDNVLPELGVRLEDKDNRTVLKLVDREQLLKERDAKLKAEAVKLAEKERRAKELAEKEAKNRIDPKVMFVTETDKYSKFDGNGLPTHDLEGKEISKGLQKKLLKLQQTQEKKYGDYLKSLQTN